MMFTMKLKNNKIAFYQCLENFIKAINLVYIKKLQYSQ